MRVAMLSVVAIVVAPVISTFAAEPSFSGVWRQNVASSQMAGYTFVIEQKSPGLYHLEGQGYGWDFDLTGKEYPTPDGGTIAYTSPADNTWDVIRRMNGKELNTLHIVFKGDTVVSVQTTKDSGGTTSVFSETSKRLSGGPGVVGRWKAVKVTGTPLKLTIKTPTPDAISLHYSDPLQDCDGKFDGMDYPVMVVGTRSHLTMAFERVTATSFRLTTKVEGKPQYVEVLSLSSNGKTLTDEGSAVGVNEPLKYTFNRQ